MSRQPSLIESFSLAGNLRRMKRPLEDAVSSGDEGTFVPDGEGDPNANADSSTLADTGPAAYDADAAANGDAENQRTIGEQIPEITDEVPAPVAALGIEAEGTTEDGSQDQGQGSAKDGSQGQGSAKDGSQDQGSTEDDQQGKGSTEDDQQGKGSTEDGPQGKGSTMVLQTHSSLLLESGLAGLSGLSGLSGSSASLRENDGLTRLACSLATGGTAANGIYRGQLCRRCFGELDWNKVVCKSKSPKSWFCLSCGNVQTMLNRHLGDWVTAEGNLTDTELQSFFSRAGGPEGRNPENGELSWRKVKQILVQTIHRSKTTKYEASLKGQYLPLSVYAKQGYNVENIEKMCQDKKEDAMLGTLYRIRVLGTKEAVTIAQVEETIGQAEKLCKQNPRRKRKALSAGSAEVPEGAEAPEDAEAPEGAEAAEGAEPAPAGTSSSSS